VNVLITGICGFIGSHLAERMKADGHEVYGVDNLETGRLKNWPEFFQLDVAERQSLYAFANTVEPDLVIHCAASYKDPDKWHRDVDTNVTGTVNATLVAKHHGCPLVYFQTALPPVSSYAISKTAGMQYIQQSGVEYLIFRLANIYGPRNLSGPIPTFYKRLKSNQSCTVVNTSRDMVYIDDLLSCVKLALDSSARGVYDVCSGYETMIIDLYSAVSSCFSEAPLAEIVEPNGDDVATELSRWDTLPFWTPAADLREGVRAAVDWYEANGVEQTFTHLTMAKG